MSPGAILVAGLAVTVGSVLQGSVGFGLGLMAAPVLVFLEPQLVPAPLLICALILTLLIAYREHEAMHVGDLGWALLGRLPGVAVGAVALALVARDRIAVMFAILIILAAAMSLLGPRFTVTPRRLMGAGLISGFMGTTISIGGPPLALLLQNHAGKRMRATMAGYFTVGITMSLVSLTFVGRLGAEELLLSGALLPGVFVGFVLSRPLGSVLDRGRIRVAVVVLSIASGTAILVRALF